jgi:hypothetical protein
MVRPGMVSYSQHGWWRPERSVKEDICGALEWNAEVLLDCETCTPETGTLGVRSLLCRIYKCSEADIERYCPYITRQELEALQPKNDAAFALAANDGKEN